MTQFEFVKRLALWFFFLLMMGGLIRLSNYYAVVHLDVVSWIINLLIVSIVGRLLWAAMHMNEEIVVHLKATVPAEDKEG